MATEPTHVGSCGKEITDDHERGDEPHTHSVHNTKPVFHEHGCENPRGCQADMDAAMAVLDAVEHSEQASGLLLKAFRLNLGERMTLVVPKKMQIEIALARACLDIAQAVDVHADKILTELDAKIAKVSKSDDPHTEEVVERAVG